MILESILWPYKVQTSLGGVLTQEEIILVKIKQKSINIRQANYHCSLVTCRFLTYLTIIILVFVLMRVLLFYLLLSLW